MAKGPKMPVTKNGKFLGYADAAQIAANPSLEVYDERKAQSIKDEKAVEKAESEKAKNERKVETAKQAGSDPSAVKKSPGS